METAVGCFGVPEDVTFLQLLFLAPIKRTTAIILSARCLMHFMGDNSDLSGRNLQLPATFVPFPSTFLLEFTSQNIMSLCVFIGG